MKSEITNIRLVYKGGAYGSTEAFGRWVYGKRPDGKTVACENERSNEGGIVIWSYWQSPDCNEHEIDTCETEFSADEWEQITSVPTTQQPALCNQILRSRESE